MGTSVSHRSPVSLQWDTAQQFYKTKKMPLSRVLSEIWRAFDAVEPSALKALKANAFFECSREITRQESLVGAVNGVREILMKSRVNAVIAELAVRAVPAAFSNIPGRPMMWLPSVFASITDYLVSRDIPGFVGENFRNRTVTDAVRFRNQLMNETQSLLAGTETLTRPQSTTEWKTAVEQAIQTLKDYR